MNDVRDHPGKPEGVASAGVPRGVCAWGTMNDEKGGRKEAWSRAGSGRAL